ncbi:MAG: hypothetical protein IJL35_06610 [Bacteroidaceae bacterium]|nr:hypothetical protein [Bacteroidaceae bacterium]
MMEKEYIQKLLDSYMAAETTKEEEQLLSDYFCTHRDIPAEWRNYSVMFRSIRQYKQKPDASNKRAIMKWSAVAAVITIIFGIGVFFMQKKDRDVEPSKSVAVEIIRQTDKMRHEPQAEDCVQTAQTSRPNNMEQCIRKADKPLVAKKPKNNYIPYESIELQEDICIDCELQTMEDKMLAMVNDFENM